MTQLVLFNTFNGLIVGAFYALMALGLSLIINLTSVINFAHGGFLALGAYIAYMLIPYIGFWGALLVAPILTALLGLVVERVLIRHCYGRDPLYSLLLTFGLAYVFEDATRYIWGAQSLPFQVPGWLMTPLSSDLFFLTGYRLFMVGAGGGGGGRPVLRAEPHPARHAHPRRHARPGNGVGAGRQRARAAQPEFRPRHLSGRAGGRAGRRPAGLAADHRRLADHAQLRRHHRRRHRQPDRHPAGRAADRRRLPASPRCSFHRRRRRSFT